MMRVVHLLDDFAMGGVMRGLSVFDEPEIAALAHHEVVAVTGRPLIAPVLEADVIVTHFPPAWNRLPFFETLKRRNPQARWIHVEHSYTAAWEARKVPSRMRFRAMLQIALHGADAIVCVSRGQRDWFERVTGLKARVVRPWSGHADLLDAEPSLRAEGSPMRLAAFGRFSEAKNFPALVEAVSALPPWLVELHLGGAGEDEQRLRAAAEPFGHIHLHGLVDDLPGFLKPMHAVIVPSLFEAFGQVALEARLAGLPILVAEVDGLTEQVGTGGLAADCSTPAAIAAAIRRFAAMPLTQMGRQGREEARGHRDEVVAGWLDLLAPIHAIPPRSHRLRELEPA